MESSEELETVKTENKYFRSLYENPDWTDTSVSASKLRYGRLGANKRIFPSAKLISIYSGLLAKWKARK